MSDLISRQDAIDYFVTNVGYHDEDGYPIEDSDELRKIWTEYFDGIPSSQPHWIPCSERLPEDSDYHDLWETPDGAVLWCKATGEIGIGWYYESTKNWCDLWDNGVKDVIAWKPLPDPYKGEQE